MNNKIHKAFTELYDKILDADLEYGKAMEEANKKILKYLEDEGIIKNTLDSKTTKD